MAPQGQTILDFYKERKSEPRVTRAKALSNKGPESSERIKSEETLSERKNTNNPDKSCNQEDDTHNREILAPLHRTPSKQNSKYTEDDGCPFNNIDDRNREMKSPSKRRSKNMTEPCSPPKMKCSSDSPAGGACNSNTGATPSTMLRNLAIASPAAEQRSSPPVRKTLHALAEFQSEPEDKLGKARVALHTHSRTSLPGREDELTKLTDFVKNHLHSRTSGSLYISGPPGTGKTACFSKILEQYDLKEQCKVISINCTSIESPKAIYSQISVKLGLKVGKRSGKAHLEAIEGFLHSHKKMIFMVLDEMDQLDTRSRSVLYTIFEWPMTYPNSIILIGIANALDLTDRILPRLKTKLQLAPQLLHFAPYTKQQLMNIFSQRLEEANASNLFQPAALQLLASKISAVNGDARRALDIARRIVEKESQKMFDLAKDQLIINNSQVPSNVLSQISEANSPRKSPRKAVAVTPFQLEGVTKQVGKSPTRMKSPLKSPIRGQGSLKENCSPSRSRKSLFKEECVAPGENKNSLASSQLHEKKGPCIDVKSIMNVVNDVYGTSQSLGRTADGGEQLPLHHKLAVCSLLLILREGKSKDVTVGKLHDVYRRVCLKRHMEPIDFGSFLSTLGLIEDRGILLLPGRGKRNRLTKVCLQWIEDEVIAALKDRELLATILKDRACLS